MKPLVLLTTIILVLSGCESKFQPENKVLTDSDRRLSASFNISEKVLLKVRSYTDSPFFQFSIHRYSLTSGSIVRKTVTTGLPGFMFNEQPKVADRIITSLRDDFEKDGYFIFLSENNFGIKRQPNHVTVIKAKDQFAVLRIMETGGVNYGLSNDSVITLMKRFHNMYNLKLIRAEGDLCEFIIQGKPKNWLELAKQAYEICPDIVDQGAGSVEALAAEMRRTQRLYFWWD